MGRSSGGGHGPRWRGVKLAEVALYLSVSMAVIVGALTTYRQASVAATVAAQAQVLTAVMAEARVALAGNDRMGGPLDTILIASGAVPPGIVMANPFPYGSRLRTEWGTELSVNLADLGEGPRLLLRLHDIPVPACTRLTPAKAGGEGVFATGLTGISVLGAGAAADPGAPPWSISQTSGLCTGAGKGADGIVTVTFRLAP